MPDSALRMEGVYKKFRKGEIYDSLRDLVPALTGKMFRRSGLDPADVREFWALQDVSFDVAEGESFGIIGPNGAGKSTVLKILSRIMRPTKGKMVVEGRLAALLEVAAGFHQDLTGRENVYLNGTILGMTRREIDAKLEAIVEFSGLHDFIDTPVKRYSSGMYARLGFSVAAHVDPDVLIVDEVLSVGDYVFQQKCIARMTEVLRSGTTVLFVSHNLRSVIDVCQRALLLDHGKPVMIGDARRVVGRYIDSMRESRDVTGKAAHIKRVTLTREGEPWVHFESGDCATLEIEVGADKDCRKVAVAVYLTDASHYSIFDTSTERLGYPPYNLYPGDTLTCSLELHLDMAYGTYHVCVLLFRYDTEEVIDSLEPAASFFVGSKLAGFRGIVNCKPRLLRAVVDSAAGELQPA
jgi:lipopolysaccharide transport system ATP-binding protein